MSVVTRFAPSPTGFLHIGGARTALFNYLFARRHGGKFLLRIEDTDRERSTDAAVDAILDGMDWLGLHADEPPIFQFARADRHRACAEAMVENGTAFRCYVTQEELSARRDQGEALRARLKSDENLSDADRTALTAEAASLLAAFRSPWRDGGTPPSSDAPYTIRLRAPDGDTITVKDRVQGEVSIDAGEIDDLILLRTDGTPTYMLAVVVDDHDMGITHVIRGDDHFRNTFRQIPIYLANGWTLPEFAHVPMIHGQDGAKLSKRHGALGIEAYRDMGYLPEGLCNYLLRLGWSHGDQELFSMDEAAAAFSLEGLNKAPARLDLDKLGAINAHHIRSADDARLLELVLAHRGNPELAPETIEQMRAAMPHLKERGQTIPEVSAAFDFLLADRPVTISDSARKQLVPEALDRLRRVSDLCSRIQPWRAENIADELKTLAGELGLGFGKIGGPLRAALTGGLPAPDLGLVMEWLGRDETLARLNDSFETKAPTTGA